MASPTHGGSVHWSQASHPMNSPPWKKHDEPNVLMQPSHRQQVPNPANGSQLTGTLFRVTGGAPAPLRHWNVPIIAATVSDESTVSCMSSTRSWASPSGA